MTDKKPRRLAAGLVLVIAFVFAIPGPAAAQIDFGGIDYLAAFRAGYSYDNDVGVESITTSGKGDVSQHIDMSIGAKSRLSKALSVEVGYGYSTDVYETYSEFDQVSHQFSGKAKARSGKLRMGLSYSRYLNELGGSDFLDMAIVNASLGGLANQNVYLQASLSNYDKDFDALNDRDSEAWLGRLDAFYFFDDYKSYLNVNLTTERESADADRFDYQGYALGATLKLKTDWLVDNNVLTLATTWRNRDYDEITPSIGKIRLDENLKMSAGFKTPIASNISLHSAYKYVDHRSNLPSSNYAEYIVSLGVGAEF
jgi:hypothetical protein